MSSNTRTQKFEASIEEGLENNALTPEAFDGEEAERRKRMARAFAHLDEDAPELTPDKKSPPTQS